MFFRLEAYVSTESDSVAINTYTKLVVLNVTLLSKAIAEVTNVCYKAHFVAEVVRDTWFDSDYPCILIVRHLAPVSIFVSETTINKKSEITCLGELVTCVWIQNKTVVVCFNVINLVTCITVIDSNCESNIPLVVDCVSNLWKEAE